MGTKFVLHPYSPNFPTYWPYLQMESQNTAVTLTCGSPWRGTSLVDSILTVLALKTLRILLLSMNVVQTSYLKLIGILFCFYAFLFFPTYLMYLSSSSSSSQSLPGYIDIYRHVTRPFYVVSLNPRYIIPTLTTFIQVSNSLPLLISFGDYLCL